MAKKVNTTLIGLFVVTAVVIFFGAIALFGSGKWLKNISRFVVYFPGTVQGLNVGAAVKFHGVTIGEVTDIQALYVPDQDKVIIPVYLEVDRGRVRNLSLTLSQGEQQRNILRQGLRAQLIMESFVTGQRAVAFEFMPGSDEKLFGLDKSVVEIPSVESPLEKLSSKLEELPLNEIAGRLNHTLAVIESHITTTEFQEGIKAIGPTITDVRGMVQKVSQDLPPLISELRLELQDLRLKQISEKTEVNLKKLEELLNTLRDNSAPLIRNSNRALQEITAMAIQFRQLAELLQRQPESLLAGKK